MKKIALFAAAAVLSSSAMASGFGQEDTFYVKAEGGMNFFQQTKDAEGAKWKGKKSGFAGVGAGYYLMENVRAELGLTYHFNPKFELKSDKKTKAKVKAMALMPKVYVDLFEISDFGAAFVGGGVGLSQISIKSGAVKVKKATKAAFSASVGAGFVVADGVKMEVRYDWNHLGKTKTKTVEGVKHGGATIKAHQAVIGARFDV